MIKDHNQALHWLKNKQKQTNKQTNKQTKLVGHELNIYAFEVMFDVTIFFINFIDRKYQKYHMYGSY